MLLTVLLLLVTGVSAVPSPENVTLSCHNVTVVVSWDYSEQRPGTSFTVQVGGSDGDLVSDTTEHQYDLSHFVLASEELFFGFHYVTVTAKEGGNQSESIPPITFSFNSLKQAHIKCKLDFPTVDLEENGSGATLSFVNPLLYGELKEAVESFKFRFSSEASSNDSDFHGACDAGDPICRGVISFPEGAKKCVKTLKGMLFNGGGAREVAFRETGPICATKPTEDHVLMLTILLFVFGIITSVLVIAICKVKAWTLEVPPKPKTLVPPNHKEGDLRYALVPVTGISPVTVMEDTLCKNPSVSSGEEEDLQDCSAHSCPYPGAYAEGALSDEDSADDSPKTVSMDLEPEEEEVEVVVEMEMSHYERRQTIQVDMGEGDMATGYNQEGHQPGRGLD